MSVPPFVVPVTYGGRAESPMAVACTSYSFSIGLPSGNLPKPLENSYHSFSSAVIPSVHSGSTWHCIGTILSSQPRQNTSPSPIQLITVVELSFSLRLYSSTPTIQALSRVFSTLQRNDVSGLMCQPWPSITLEGSCGDVLTIIYPTPCTIINALNPVPRSGKTSLPIALISFGLHMIVKSVRLFCTHKAEVESAGIALLAAARTLAQVHLPTKQLQCLLHVDLVCLVIGIDGRERSNFAIHSS